jgi:nucleoside-diphosphate-sugar epimerase
MMRWLSRGIPLPLGAIVDNRRSLLAVDNLADLIAACVTHPNAAGQVFLAADGEDVSTTDLLRKMAAALGVPARLVPVPVGLLKAVTRLAGKEGIAQRLCGSLQVDISKAVDLLEWRPPMSMDVALRETARAFHEARS